MPASIETGVGPKEYEELRNAKAIKNENEELKKELEGKKLEIEKMEKDYLTLAKNNEQVLSKLDEAQTQLDILENEGIPKFNSEKTDKNSILAYLNNNKAVLEERIKGIEIVNSNKENKIIFYTIGYGEKFNQLFIWNEGDSYPTLINNATFSQKGKLEWLNNKFLQIDTGTKEYKILDIEDENVINTFYSKHQAFLIPQTSSYIIQKDDSNLFYIYDFINTKEQEIDINYKNKFIAFDVDDDNIIFSGTYSDDFETQYTVKAVIKLEILKEKYGVVSIDEAIKLKENEKKDEAKGNEPIDTGKGTM